MTTTIPQSTQEYRRSVGYVVDMGVFPVDEKRAEWMVPVGRLVYRVAREGGGPVRRDEAEIAAFTSRRDTGGLVVTQVDEATS